ncbi:M14 family zinc carboxypeptidase [Streptomyces sp. N50]|uniref:M14 family zinc carboxypeptidase n=1 Tax=Streptomyces sp. N50 TaxID=3081765 RepID=UPI002962341E|nr:M14 family zinc carboxypeptidase [Streptomyces sp. N50]WOX09424.1 M14 family zinc carboxypeptidase [Streptomyces sp. N50]
MRTIARAVPPRPVLITAVALTTAAGSLLLQPRPADATPRPVPRRGSAPDPAVREGSGPDRYAGRAPVTAARRALTATVPRTDPRLGYPRRQRLSPDPANPADTSLKLGLTPYHALAPRLNSLQRLGDRVSAEVAGVSSGGHRLYLVTVTAPETTAQATAQERMRDLIENAPATAAKSFEIKTSYKTPVLFDNNIHGDEREGTDASLDLIQQLATANDTKTKDLLAHSRLYFNITANPDGRIAGTRANANGFDLNRDLITASQPEARAIRALTIDKQPAVLLDLHGYVNGTLIEPTTPPHGENYEYDLFLKNTYANALGMETAVNALGYTPAKDGVSPAQIPFRDQAEGWDDWPPVFTPQYAAFQGAVAAHTVEIPLQVNNSASDTLPTTELHRRAAINVAVAGAAMRATLDFARSHRTSLIADQIEMFRRGAAGVEQVPVSARTVPGVPGIGPEDVYTTTFPRAYTIAPDTAGARLVTHLIANDVRVLRAATGPYVVDTHQPKRGLANALLADGRDISDKVTAMYDISAWSLGRLWGAQVKAVTTLPSSPLAAITAPSPVAHVAPHGDLRLPLTDPAELAALNSLLRQGIPVRRSADGSAIVPEPRTATARAKVTEAATAYDVAFEATTLPGVTALHPVRVAAAVTPGELFALREMGFEVTPVSTDILNAGNAGNAGFDWSKADVLFVSTELEDGDLTPTARTALRTFLSSGHGLVGRGVTGAALASATGLLTATPVEGTEEANGVVRVVNSGPITTGTQPYGFVYAPVWFTELGPTVRVEQSYTTGSPLLAGHWRKRADGSGGPADAAGRPSVVSDRRAVLFGTEPLFRDHPKGELPQVGRALFTMAHTIDGTRAMAHASSGSVEESR